MTRILLWQETHPTVHGGAESWLGDTIKGLKLRGHQLAWFSGKEIQQAVEQFQPDVVILGTLHCFVGLQHVAWLADQKIPAVWMMHDYWSFCGPRMLLQKINQTDESCEAVDGICRNSCGGQVNLQGLVNRFCVVTGCEGAAQIMRRNGVNVRGIVEEGIDTELFKPSGKQRDRSTTIYASAAGNDIWKGIHILNHAVDGLNLNVRFLTGLSRPELASKLKNASIYVFPSVYQEIWGLTLTEAMASGCAVVASDVAGARAQVHRGLGVLVPPRDPVALREALGRLTMSPELAKQMGEAAREHVEKEHSLEAIGKRWEAVCKSVREETLCRI